MFQREKAAALAYVENFAKEAIASGLCKKSLTVRVDLECEIHRLDFS